MTKISLAIVSIILIAIASVFIYLSSSDQPLFAFNGAAPTNLGISDGKLAPCLSTPNCVSSQASDPQHQIDPISYSSSTTEAYDQVKKLLESQKRIQIITQTDNYIYAIATSHLMGFVDDVEFYFQPDTKVIDVRSSSRIGESDLGVNRQRIEQVRSEISRG
jgi:uncharacterized protein (DUF1499 family)